MNFHLLATVLGIISPRLLVGAGLIFAASLSGCAPSAEAGEEDEATPEQEALAETTSPRSRGEETGHATASDESDAPVFTAAAPTGRDPRQIALLIGIADYEHFEETGPAGQTDLFGPTGDVDRLRHQLARFHFDEHVRVLKNEQATREGILDALRWLAEEATEPDDAVVVYYSGHGVPVEDRNGDEEDGWDEALVPQDAPRWEEGGAPDAEVVIIDDLIGEALEGLGTENVTVIIDACFSGSVTRGGPTAVQRRFPRARGPIIERSSDSGMGDVVADQPMHVLLTASSPREVAWEIDLEPAADVARPGGIFTHHLIQALETAAPSTTYDDVMRDVQRRVRAEFRQTPQLEGQDRHARLFRVNTPVAPRPFARITRAEGAEAPYRLNIGAVHGVRMPSVYDVFAAGDEELVPSSRLGQVEVVEVADTTALATPLEGTGSLPSGARAVMALAPRGATLPDHIRVLPQGGAGEVLSGLLEAGHTFVRSTSDPGAPVVVTEEDGLLRVFLQDLQGQEIVPIRPEVEGGFVETRVDDEGQEWHGYLPDPAALCRPLRRAYAILAYKGLENDAAPPTEDLDVTVRWVPTGSGAPDGESAVDTLYYDASGDIGYDLYGRVDVSLTKVDISRLYMTVAVEGFISSPAVVPLPWPEDRPVPGFNEWLRLLENVALEPPPGTEVLKVLVGSDQWDFGALHAALPECARARSGETARGDFNRWSGRPTPVEGWTAAEFPFVILPR